MSAKRHKCPRFPFPHHHHFLTAKSESPNSASTSVLKTPLSSPVLNLPTAPVSLFLDSPAPYLEVACVPFPLDDTLLILSSLPSLVDTMLVLSPVIDAPLSPPLSLLPHPLPTPVQPEYVANITLPSFTDPPPVLSLPPNSAVCCHKHKIPTTLVTTATTTFFLPSLKLLTFSTATIPIPMTTVATTSSYMTTATRTTSATTAHMTELAMP